MMFRPRNRRRLAWLAFCAVAFASVAPTLGQWLAASSGTTWVEICTATGFKRVALDMGEVPAPTDDHADATHCPYCRLQNDMPTVEQATIVLFIATVARDTHRPPAEASPLPPVRPWPAARSRAPPRFS